MGNKLKKIFSNFLILVVIVGIVPVHALAKGDLMDEVNSVGDDNISGGVKLTKTVSPINKDKGIYNIKFDLSSENMSTANEKSGPLYVAIVFDTSGSMCEENSDNCGNKWNNAVSSTIDFSKELLKNAKNANIALVNFADGAKVSRNFANKELETNNFKSPNGGSNIAKGLSEAKKLLDSIKEEDAKKIIVLMADGEPNVYMNLGTDYLARVQAKNMASNIKKASIELFAIGYDTTTSASDFLKILVTEPNDKYYIDGHIDDIKFKFNNLISEIYIFPAARDVIITDIIGSGFNYVDNSASEGVVIDNDKITYKVDELSAEPVSFDFNIQIEQNNGTGWHSTNKEATISYMDALGDNITKKITKSSKVYWQAPKYDYVINYYKDEISDENLIDSIKGSDDYNKEITVDTKYKLPEGYGYNEEALKFNVKEKDNEINVIYTKKDNLTYCVNYFYEGIVDINNTECYYNQPYGKEITSFIDKPKEGYVFESFDSITVLDQEENIMNVYYKKLSSGEIVPPKTSVNIGNTIGILSIPSLLLIGVCLLRKHLNV